MAVKIFGSCSGSSGSKYNVWLDVTENSHNISKNTSNLTINLNLKRNDGYSSSAYNLNKSDNFSKITINSVTKTSKNLEIDTRNCVTVTLASWTGNVTHNADGSLTITVGGSFTMGGTSLSGGDVSGNFKCITIPRASDFTTDKTTVDPDEEVTVTITPASPNFSHTLIYEIGDYKSNISLIAGTTGTTFSIPAEWINVIPDAKQGTVKLTLKTYNSATLVGSSVKYLKLTVPEMEKYLPEYTIDTVYNKNGIVPGIWNAVVQNISTVTISLCNLNCKYGAEVASSYIIVGLSKKYGLKNEFSLPDSGVVTVTTRITDTRGYSTEKIFMFNVDEYTKPTVTCSNIYRCDSSGVPSSAASCVAIEFERIYSAIRGLNYGYVNAKYKKSTESEYSDLITLSSSPFIISGDFQESSSYDFVISIYDSVTKTPFEINRTLPSGNIPFNIKSGGKGAAFGCYAENDNELTVGYDLNVKGGIKYTDISSFVNVGEKFEVVDLEIRHYECLGLVIFRGLFTTCEEVGVNGWTGVFSFDGILPKQPNAVSATAVQYLVDKNLCAILDGNGNIKIATDIGLSTGSDIALNGFFMNK